MNLFASLTPLAAAALIAPLAQAGGLDSLDRFLKDTHSGKAAFTQVVTQPPKQGRAAAQKTSSGTFEFLRPGQFRFHYEKPFEQTIVADGQTLWLYDVDLNQVTARRQEQVLDSTPAAIVAAAPDLKTLEKSFALADEPEQDGLQWVRATPKTRDTQIQSVRVGFKPATENAAAVLTTLEITDSFGQRSTLTFTDVQNNAALPRETFQFHPPAGADVIRN
ncbi:MAG: outer membrane lipoprotein chaperone LolA [Burkholderiaceae bacterium]|jgi:outer membrane lipoprotein carrier protein|nr:outer membrane lipoprotein chaperone LolA [Burkholderiaceae bacterium]